jgi:hypothetical protein
LQDRRWVRWVRRVADFVAVVAGWARREPKCPDPPRLLRGTSRWIPGSIGTPAARPRDGYPDPSGKSGVDPRIHRRGRRAGCDGSPNPPGLWPPRPAGPIRTSLYCDNSGTTLSVELGFKDNSGTTLSQRMLSGACRPGAAGFSGVRPGYVPEPVRPRPVSPGHGTEPGLARAARPRLWDIARAGPRAPLMGSSWAGVLVLAFSDGSVDGSIGGDQLVDHRSAANQTLPLAEGRGHDA